MKRKVQSPCSLKEAFLEEMVIYSAIQHVLVLSWLWSHINSCKAFSTVFQGGGSKPEQLQKKMSFSSPKNIKLGRN